MVPQPAGAFAGSSVTVFLAQGSPTPVAPVRVVMGRSATAASCTLVGDGRLRLPRPILTASDHAGLCFLWLVL